MEGMDNPHAPRRINVTIKFPESARYKADNPWITFEGSITAVRLQIIEAFGMSEADSEGLGLFEIVSNAQSMATALGTLKAGLGGARVINPGGATPAPVGGDGDAWATAGSTPAAPEKSELEVEVERLTSEVGKVTTVAALQELWARNQEAFKDAGLMATYKAKGKQLSA